MPDELPEPNDLQSPERYSDTNRSFRIEKLSGLVDDSVYGKLKVGILPDGKRPVEEEGES